MQSQQIPSYYYVSFINVLERPFLKQLLNHLESTQSKTITHTGFIKNNLGTKYKLATHF